VVERIRAEKANLLRRALQGPDDPETSSYTRSSASGPTRLSQVRGQ
jgi:hypothetical protein